MRSYWIRPDPKSNASCPYKKRKVPTKVQRRHAGETVTWRWTQRLMLMLTKQSHDFWEPSEARKRQKVFFPKAFLRVCAC